MKKDLKRFLAEQKRLHRKVGVIRFTGMEDTALYLVSTMSGDPLFYTGFVNGEVVSHSTILYKAVQKWDAEVTLYMSRKKREYIAVGTGVAAAVLVGCLIYNAKPSRAEKINETVPTDAVSKEVSETILTREEADVLDARDGAGRWAITYEVTPDHIDQEKIDDEISENFDAMCDVVYAEAGNQGDRGMRLVADVIINRMRNNEAFGDTLHDVLYAAGQFSCISDGGAAKWQGHNKDEVRKICQEELKQVTDPNVYYFRTGHFGYGRPLYKYKAHYFSGR